MSVGPLLLILASLSASQLPKNATDTNYCAEAINPDLFLCDGSRCMDYADPVDLAFGTSMKRNVDASLVTSRGTINFERYFNSNPLSWANPLSEGNNRPWAHVCDFASTEEPGWDAIPKPFGASGNGNNLGLRWWHNFYSFVYMGWDQNGTWVILADVHGRTWRYDDCSPSSSSGVCFMTPKLAYETKSRHRLARRGLGTGASFVFYPYGSPLRYVYSAVSSAGARCSGAWYFLSAIETNDGQAVASVTYANPRMRGCIQDADWAPNLSPSDFAPYIDKVASIDGGAFKFTYKWSVRPDLTKECVVDTVTKVGVDGVETPAVQYDYAGNTPGLLSTVTHAPNATPPTKWSETYSYPSNKFVTSIGQTDTSYHQYSTTTGQVAQAWSQGDGTRDFEYDLSCQVVSGEGSSGLCTQPTTVNWIDTNVATGKSTARTRKVTWQNSRSGDGYLNAVSGDYSRRFEIGKGATTCGFHGPVIRRLLDRCNTGTCGDGTHEEFEWDCPATNEPSFEKGHRSNLGSWSGKTYGLPQEPNPNRDAANPNTSIPPSNLVEVRDAFAGATDSAGTDAILKISMAYKYGPWDEQLLASVSQTSTFGEFPEATTTIEYEHDTYGKLTTLPRAVFRKGRTHTINGTAGGQLVDSRTVGIFFFRALDAHGTCLGSNDRADAGGLNRITEVHGPCYVTGTAALDCDVPNGTGMISFPVTQLSYWPGDASSNRGRRLKEVLRYPSGGTATGGCVGQPLSTRFDTYSPSGRPTTIVGEDGVTTRISYDENDRITGLDIGNRLRVSDRRVYRLGYENGHLRYIQYPAGNFETFCHWTSDSEDCSVNRAGEWSENLVWRAKSGNMNGLGWSERVDYSYYSNGRLKTAASSTCTAYYQTDGRCAQALQRTTLHFDQDQLDHLRWRGAGISRDPATYPYTAVYGTANYDANGNLAAYGIGANHPPTFCQVSGSPDKRCTFFGYDRADRLTSVASYALATSADPERTCIGRDAQGNVSAVATGCTLSSSTACDDGSGGGVISPYLPAACADRTTRYEYDDFGNLTAVTLPNTNESGGSLAGTIRFEYDATGNLTGRETPSDRAAGAKFVRAFDMVGRLLRESRYFGSAPTVLAEYNYDAWPTTTPCDGSNAGTVQSRLAFVRDSFGGTWFAYNEWGDVVAEYRRRYGIDGPIDCAAGTMADKPTTRYGYSRNGKITSITYPLGGRSVTYAMKAGHGLEDRVDSVSVSTFDGTSWVSTAYLTNVRWEPYGGLAGYELPTTGLAVDWLQHNEAGEFPSCASPRATSDGTGRPGGVLVSAASAYPRNGDLYRQVYKFDGELMSNKWTCALGESNKESFQYDLRLRLTSADATGSTGRLPYTSRTFGYDAAGNMTTETANGASRVRAFNTGIFGDQLLQRRNGATGAVDLRASEFDQNGRAKHVQWAPWSDASISSEPTPPRLALSYPGSTDKVPDEVFSSVSVFGKPYFYYYDYQGRRWRKESSVSAEVPSRDDFYYDLGHQLLVDQGMESSPANLSTNFAVDEYVWLAGRPVMLIRGRISPSWVLQSDTSARCTRNGETAPCGVFFLVTDYQAKPVAMIDSTAKLTAVADYDPFGRVNFIESSVDTPHPYPTHPDRFQKNFVGSVAGPSSTSAMSVEMRGVFHQIDMEGHYYDEAWISDSSGNEVEYDGTGVVRYSNWHQNPMKSRWLARSSLGLAYRSDYSNCMPTDHAGGIDTNFCGDYPFSGASLEGAEYRKFDNRTTWSFTPLRFPGHYYDEETELNENWHRYYDSRSGRYLQSEPMMANSNYVVSTAASGIPINPYGYAANNPVTFTDPDGRYIFTTLVGGIWGLVGILGGGSASLQWGGYGPYILIEGHPLQPPQEVTLGPVVCSNAPKIDPGTKVHEEAHVGQFYFFLGDNYLPAHLAAQAFSKVLSGNTHRRNLLEPPPEDPTPWGGWRKALP